MRVFPARAMNELFIYNLFQEILNHSTVIEGRFAVIKSGADTNESNHGELVRDALGGLTTTRKYPAAVLLPPMEIVPSYNKGWSTYRMVMYFLTLDGRTGANELKTADYDALISDHPVTHDWKDMRECAGNFRVAFNNVVRQPSVINQVRDNHTNPDMYERISWAGNDKVNGVRVSFEVDLFMPCDLADYPANIAQLVNIPYLNPHPLHKH